MISLCFVMFIFLTITRDLYCCSRRGEDGNGGGDPKGKNTNTAPDPKQMTTFERGMLRYLQGKTTDVISRGEEPPYGGLYALGTVLQQTRLFLIHQLKKLSRKINLRYHITRMAKYWDFV
jgi:hypothetical protein